MSRYEFAIKELENIINSSEKDIQFLLARKNVLIFSLVWLLFEKTVKRFCNGNSSMFQVRNFVDSINNNYPENTNDIFNYFRNRYGNNNSKFEGLHWRNTNDESQIKEDVKNILNNENVIEKDKLFAILTICYRLRHNLFHGNKEYPSLLGQEEIFEIVNKLLIQIIKQNSRA